MNLAILHVIVNAVSSEEASSRFAAGAAAAAAPVSVAERRYLREQVRSMFVHAYDSYLAHGWASDVLAPISCQGEDGWGGIALTLLDTLDTLAIMNNASEFERGVRFCVEQLSFDKDETVSLFETNIRALGGLLSAHAFASGAMLPFTSNHIRLGSSTTLALHPRLHLTSPAPHLLTPHSGFLQIHSLGSSPLLTPRVPRRDQTPAMPHCATPFADGRVCSFDLIFEMQVIRAPTASGCCRLRVTLASGCYPRWTRRAAFHTAA